MTAHIAPKLLWWEPVLGHDTTSILKYVVYFVPGDTELQRHPNGDVVNLVAEFDLGKPPVDSENRCVIDLAQLPKIKDIEGRYNLGVVAVDSGKNESPFLEINDVSVDFTPPPAPGKGGILS